MIAVFGESTSGFEMRGHFARRTGGVADAVCHLLLALFAL